MAGMHRGTALGDGFRYAKGWREGRIGPARALHHGGILPDFRGKMILLPDPGAAVVVLTNASTLMPLPAQPTSHRLADEIAAYLAGKPLASGTLSLGTTVFLRSGPVWRSCLPARSGRFGRGQAIRSPPGGDFQARSLTWPWRQVWSPHRPS
jgi:hypothetical protein